MTAMNAIYSLFLLYCITCVHATRLDTTYPVSMTSKQDVPWIARPRKGVVELELQRTTRRRTVRRQVDGGEAGTAAIGLGDALDITYNVLVQVSNVSTPLVLDTGSADLWVLSDGCSICSGASYPLYSSGAFEPVADARLFYGDSRTGTHAFGLIGADRTGVAGLVLEYQYFAAINDTNTSVLDTGSAGIFGLGFPINSILWNELYAIATSRSSSSASKRQSLPRTNLHSRPRTLPTPTFPDVRNLAVEDNVTTTDASDRNVEILSSFSTYGPLVSRLVLDSVLASPEFSVTLQRTVPALGGNVGTFTLGGLPNGVNNASLTWSSVRRYTEEQNGVFVPRAPKETYPYAWDIPLDAVYFDGVRLPSSTLGDVSKEGVGQSSLIDTGNSLIRGPADIIVAILSILIDSSSASSPFTSHPHLDGASYTEEDYAAFTHEYDSLVYAYPCSEAHSLVFEFSGQKLQVDPRDFGRPFSDAEDGWCVPNLAPTDPPEIGGYLYSWSLGEPFLRGVLASFYYGNLTHPSSDPPRIGFLSTVPDDATLRLDTAVEYAQSIGEYPETTITAPTGTYTDGAVTTNTLGIVQASESPLPSELTSSAQRRHETIISCLFSPAFRVSARLWDPTVLCALLALIGARRLI